MDAVSHDCRTCAHAQVINRFKAHCDAIDRDITRPRKCAYFRLSEDAQAFNAQFKGVKL